MAETDSNYKRWGEGLGLLVAAGAIFSGGYWFGQQPGSDLAATQKAFIALDLPARIKENAEATNQLRLATQEFSNMLINNKTYEAMKKEFDGLAATANRLEKDNERLKAQLADTSRQLGEANVRIEQLTTVDQNYELRDGEAITISDNLLTVGLIEVAFGGKAAMKFNGLAKEATAGDVFDVKATNDKPCTIRVTNVAYVGSTVKFAADCSAAQE